MKVGWFVGKDNWAYKNQTSEIIEHLPDIDHEFNTKGDVTIVMSLDQLRRKVIGSENRINRKNSRTY